MGQVWELATTIGQLADNGLLSLVDGSVFALWKMRVLGTRVGRGACIFGGSRCVSRVKCMLLSTLYRQS